MGMAQAAFVAREGLPLMFSHIDPRYLDAVWPKVESLLASAIAKGYGEATVDQMKLVVRQGFASLVVWHENDEVISAGIVEFINYPQYRVARCSYLSGRYTEESFAALKDWCKEAMGASKIECFGSDAIARLYANYGFEKKYNMLRSDL